MATSRSKLAVKIFWTTFISGLFLIILLFTLVSAGQLGYMPDFDELENPKSNLATEIIASDNVLIGKFYTENRTVTHYNDISPNMVNALIATEDIRFYKHSGVDVRALFRVVTGLMSGSHKGGGSTISQQLAKNLFRMRERSVPERAHQSKIGRVFGMAIMKFKEWVTAIRLERRYTKEEILAMYLNTVDFGSQAMGIESAARTFFGTFPSDLTLEQSAVLVGLLKAPTKYSPVLNPENSLERRNLVLAQMKKYKFIEQSVVDSVKTIPLTLNYNVETHNKGLAPYFREYLRLTLMAEKPVRRNYSSAQENLYLEELDEWETNPLYGWCNKNLKPDGEPYNIYTDGLKIYTTVNSKMQQYAEEAVETHVGKHLQPLFFKRKGTLNDYKAGKNEKGPFAWDVSKDEIETMIRNSMVRSERYRMLKKARLDSAEILKNFKTPVRMKVFSWRGEIDTVMTPLDSIWHYKYYLNAGFMSVEPETGFVRAYVGGVNFQYFKFDHLKFAKRQVGSTFKPFIYTLAMANGLSPCYKVPNEPITIPMPEGQPPYTPKYSQNKYGPEVTLKRGLASSLNQISAWIMRECATPEAVIDVVKKMGVKSHIEPVPSICVGSAEVTLYEMVGAYTAFVNRGMYTQPIFVTRIENKNGNVLATFKPRKQQAMHERTAYLMLQLLKGVVQGGTSTAIWAKYGLKNEIGGKTGTTNDNSDGWFIGVTPDLVSGAWVGGENRSIRFSSSSDGQGSSMALPIFALYMQKVYADKSLGYSQEARFFTPKDPIEVDLNCDNTYQEDNEFFDAEDEFLN